MKIIVEELARHFVGDTAIQRLASALQPQAFAGACCTGAFGRTMVYLRCPNAPHGVIADVDRLDDTLQWIIDMLADSTGARSWGTNKSAGKIKDCHVAIGKTTN